MGKKYSKINLIHRKRSYTPQEIAKLLDVNKQTCSRWVKEGLKPIKPNARPLLIKGVELITFLKKQKGEKKITLLNNQYLCLKCRAGVYAKTGSERTVNTGKKIGKTNRWQTKKIALCANCNSEIHRYT